MSKIQTVWREYYSLYAAFFLSLAIALLALGCGEADPEPPIIFDMTAEPEMVEPGQTSIVAVNADDADSDNLSYQWSASAGDIEGNGESVTWRSPEIEGVYELTVTVSDGSNSVSKMMEIRVSRNYYPLTIGNKWTFLDSDGNTISFEIVDNIAIEVLGVTTFVKQTTSSGLEDSANFTYINPGPDGIYQYGMGGSNAGGDTITFSPELPIYKFPPVPGASWEVEFDVQLEFGYFVGNGVAVYEVVGEEQELTVEAGTFQHVFQIKEDFTWELEGEPIDRIITYHWLAADVGVVKFRQEETVGGQVITTEAVLQSYSLE